MWRAVLDAWVIGIAALFASSVADQYRSHGVGAALLTLLAVCLFIEIVWSFWDERKH